jgi:Zn-dependent M28 family amino/carboxypeptidase
MCLFVLVLLSGCRRPNGDAPFKPGAVSGDRALEETRGLVAISPRDAGTAGAAKAAEHLASRLKAIGLEVEVDTFREPTPRGLTTFRNVMGRIPGEGKGLIILGSHYDTKSGVGPGFQGANDSGSSSGLLLELGSVLKKGPRVSADIMLVFFDGEECMISYGPHDGFHGSRHLAKQLVTESRSGSVIGVIILDMIGDKHLDAWLPANNTPELSRAVLLAAKEEGVLDRFSKTGHAVGDDHVAFLEAGMPAADIIDFQFGSAPGLNDYWHTQKDTIDKLSAESLETVGRVVVRVVNGLVADSR